MIHPPSELQGVLWSAPVAELDTERDRVYIIHQILAYGTLDDLRWLFSTYGKEVIQEVFARQPMKIYTASSLHFSALLLGLRSEQVPQYRYDKSLPRHIG